MNFVQIKKDLHRSKGLFCGTPQLGNHATICLMCVIVHFEKNLPKSFLRYFSISFISPEFVIGLPQLIKVDFIDDFKNK